MSDAFNIGLIGCGTVGGGVAKLLLEQPEPSPDFAAYRQPTGHIRDLLVCTHGTRDRCCATFGYPVYNRLRRTFEQNESGTNRVWRVRVNATTGNTLDPLVNTVTVFMAQKNTATEAEQTSKVTTTCTQCASPPTASFTSGSPSFVFGESVAMR